MTGVTAAGGPRIARGLRAAGALSAVLLAVVTGTLTLLVPATPAQAHAAMVAATPVPGTVLGASPTEITVAFSEAVTVVIGKVQVLAPDGKRISGTARASGSILHIPVRRADRPLGTYLVSYRVISADSHPVAGAFTFSVGAPSAVAPQQPKDEVHPSVAVALPAARLAGYAGLVLAIGPTLFLALLWPRRLSRRGPVRLVRGGLALIALSTLAAVWLQAPYSSGAALHDVSGTELKAVLASPLGAVMTARLAVLGVIAALLRPLLLGRAGRVRVAVLLALAVGAATTWPLSGHAGASPLPAVVVAADVVHLAAMALWLGGLVTLVAFLLPRAHPRVLGVILPAWSRWATIAVVWLVGGGAVQAFVQVGSVSALAGTGYGRLLLAKIALLAVVLAVAAYARRLVRRAQVPAAGAARMRRTVGIEVAATAVVLALSAVLVQVTPGGRAQAQQAADAVQGVSQTLTCPLYTLQFNIYPVQVGENNTVHAFVYTAAGKPLPAQEWSVTTVLQGQDLGPVTTRMLGVLPHHAIGAITFPLPGVYEVRFTVRTTEIDQATVRTTVTVR
jgi:copper transport protein